jgi:hypothetical protein
MKVDVIIPSSNLSVQQHEIVSLFEHLHKDSKNAYNVIINCKVSA